MLVRAVEMKASDVVLGPNDSVWVSQYGEWLRGTRRVLVPTELSDLLNQIARSPSAAAQVGGGLDLDFAYELYVDRFTKLRFRVNATGCRSDMGSGIEMTLRSIPGVPPSLESLNVEEGITSTCFPLFGLVLVTGPVGSGKTTLLAGMLGHSAKVSRKRILTYESPVEFDLRGIPDRIAPVTQTEVPVDLRNGWGATIRNSLRRAGNIVLVGESRDAETFESLLEGAETGVAVYSTAHTNGVAHTISRIADAFPYEVRDGTVRKMIASLRLIVNQRLFPNPNGGRTAIREFLPFTPELRHRLLDLPYARIIPAIEEAIEASGQSLLQDAKQKLAEGRLYPENVEEIAKITGTGRPEQEQYSESRVESMERRIQEIFEWLKKIGKEVA